MQSSLFQPGSLSLLSGDSQLLFHYTTLVFSWNIFLKMNSIKLYALSVIGFMLMALLQLGYGQGTAPSPAPEAPSNDGNTIDQGIAYVLLLVALAITYIFH